MEGLLLFVARLHQPTERDIDAARAERELATMEMNIAVRERDYVNARYWAVRENAAIRELDALAHKLGTL